MGDFAGALGALIGDIAGQQDQVQRQQQGQRRDGQAGGEPS